MWAMCNTGHRSVGAITSLTDLNEFSFVFIFYVFLITKNDAHMPLTVKYDHGLFHSGSEIGHSFIEAAIFHKK